MQYRYTWDAMQDDGSVMGRFALDGTEQIPDPWRTRQCHLYSLAESTVDPVSIFIPKGAHFTIRQREVMDFRSEIRHIIVVAGWAWMPDGSGCYLSLAPDGSLGLADNPKTRTAFERSFECDAQVIFSR